MGNRLAVMRSWETRRIPLRKRFESFVNKTRNCWLWLGAISNQGYGQFSIASKRVVASRIAHQIYKGPIPEGLTIDHLCRNRVCVNPAHLEAVTMRENTLRGNTIPAANSRKTECLQGHPYNEANTYLRPKGGRDCRECQRRRYRDWYTQQQG